MKFLTDENIATSVVKKLRSNGFDVKDIKEESLQGIKDTGIIKTAYDEDRIIITHDKDFEEIAYKNKHNGIILVRLKDQKPKNVSEKIIKAISLEIKNKFKNNLIIIKDDRVIIKRVDELYL